MVTLGLGGPGRPPAHPSPACIPRPCRAAAALSPPAEQGFSAHQLVLGHKDAEGAGGSRALSFMPQARVGHRAPAPGRLWAGWQVGGGPPLLPFSSGMVHFLTKAFDIRQAAPLAGLWAGHSTPLWRALCPRQGAQGRLLVQATLLPTGASTPPRPRPRPHPGGDWALCRAEPRRAV